MDRHPPRNHDQTVQDPCVYLGITKRQLDFTSHTSEVDEAFINIVVVPFYK
jgi:hypothetical protein